MSEQTIINEKVELMDVFSQKMANSGHCLDVIRKSISNGVKGHLRKKERCRLEGKPFHRSSASSARERRTKRLLQKQSLMLRLLRSQKTTAREARPEGPGWTTQRWPDIRTVTRRRARNNNNHPQPCLSSSQGEGPCRPK